MTFLSHVTPLAQALASQDDSGIICGTNTFLGQDNKNEVQHDFFVMCGQWCWHWFHMMQMASSIVAMHSSCQDN